MIAAAAPLCAPPRWVTWLVVAVATLAFLPTLGGGFLGDDFVYIARFRELPWREWPALFTHEWSGGVWGMQLRELRPFAALSFMGDARLFGGSALGYRLTNLGLHLVSTVIVARLAWRYSDGRWIAALVAGLAFALHPAHVEAVSWITGRVDLQATAAALLFWLGAEQFVERGRAPDLALLLVAFFVGIFSKELCMFAPLLLVLRWLLLDPRAAREIWQRRALALGGALLLLALYGFCRRAAFGHDAIGYNLWTDGPAWQRQASYVGWLLPVLPFTPTGEWQAPPPLATLHAVWLGIAGVTLFAFAFARWRNRPLASAAIFFAGVWYLASVFPLTGVTYFSPRHLYFPSIGLALALGLAAAATRSGRVLGGAIVLWCAVAHVAALQPWRLTGRISREAVGALDRGLAAAPNGTLALIAVPERIGPAWLWAWSSPACAQLPFVSRGAGNVLERAGNFSNGDYWATRKPLETVRAASGAFAVYADANGRVASRFLDRDELQRRSATLAPGGVAPEAWSEWVRSLVAP